MPTLAENMLHAVTYARRLYNLRIDDLAHNFADMTNLELHAAFNNIARCDHAFRQAIHNYRRIQEKKNAQLSRGN